MFNVHFVQYPSVEDILRYSIIGYNCWTLKLVISNLASEDHILLGVLALYSPCVFRWKYVLPLIIAISFIFRHPKHFASKSRNLDSSNFRKEERRNYSKILISVSAFFLLLFPQFVSSSLLPVTGKNERTAGRFFYIPSNQEGNKLQ